MRVVASHNPDIHIRHSSSAGGVFSILADQIIQRDGVVYGAAFDNHWKVRHIRVENPVDLERMRGSKYVFSDFLPSISEALSDLALGKTVLYSGTPCQIAALKKKVGENDNLYLVEVVCHGAPEKKYWEAYLDEICAKLSKNRSQIVAIDFRDKSTGWKNYSFTIKFDDGGLFSQPHGENIYMRAFLADYTLREACFHCPFKYPEGSKADLTIGDFWGITQLAPKIDNDLGTTMILIRSKLGEQLFQEIGIDWEICYDDVILYNPAIVKKANKPKHYNKFKTEILGVQKCISVMTKYSMNQKKLYHKLLKIKNILFNK